MRCSNKWLPVLIFRQFIVHCVCMCVYLLCTWIYLQPASLSFSLYNTLVTIHTTLLKIKNLFLMVASSLFTPCSKGFFFGRFGFQLQDNWLRTKLVLNSCMVHPTKIYLPWRWSQYFPPKREKKSLLRVVKIPKSDFHLCVGFDTGTNTTAGRNTTTAGTNTTAGTRA